MSDAMRFEKRTFEKMSVCFSSASALSIILLWSVCSFSPKNKSRKEHRRRRRRLWSSTNSNSLDWCVHYKNISHRLQRKTVIILLIFIYIKIYKFSRTNHTKVEAKIGAKSSCLPAHDDRSFLSSFINFQQRIFYSIYILAFFDNHIAREITVVAQKMFDELSAMVIERDFRNVFQCRKRSPFFTEPRCMCVNMSGIVERCTYFMVVGERQISAEHVKFVQNDYNDGVERKCLRFCSDDRDEFLVVGKQFPHEK